MVLVIGNFDQADIDHLEQQLLPVEGTNVPSGPVGLDFIVAFLEDLLSARAPQHIDQHGHTNTLSEPGDG